MNEDGNTVAQAPAPIDEIQDEPGAPEPETIQDEDFEEEVPEVYDPLEPFNRAMFTFNDRLYFRVMKPIGRGYNYIVPEPARTAVRRFFTNLATPIRLGNALLQLKFKSAGVELSRFLINTTVGVAGFMDPARERWDLDIREKDLGQTLGRWGFGSGLYINWPFIGPSSARDTFGFAGDIFLDPLTYLFTSDQPAGLGVAAYKEINETSLEIGTYESVKEEALDPYVFVRDAYMQRRDAIVREARDEPPF